MFKRPIWAAGAFLLLCGIHLWIFAMLPEARKERDWVTIALHNWHEEGFWKLGGKLVCNPGGLDPGETPIAYPGHRPTLAYPPYLLKELPGAAGGNGLFYDFVMTLLTFLGLRSLFGNDWRWIIVAFAVCLSPGYISNVATIDTISFPAVLGIAVMTFVGGRVAQGDKRPLLQPAVIAVLGLYMLLNWSTLISLFSAAVYLWVKRPGQKRLAVYLGLGLAVGMAVFAVSMLSRHESGATSQDFWNAYLLGPTGYDGSGMTWGKALLRVSAVNVIAWLPLIVTTLILVLCQGRSRDWRAVLPLFAAVLSVFALRNYFAHHPWGAVCFIGLGLVFTLELLVLPGPAVETTRGPGKAVAAPVFALLYCVAWLAFDEFNSREFNTLHAFLIRQTPRHSVIVLADSIMPGEIKDLKPVESTFDRKMIAADAWEQKRAEAERSGREIFVLSHGAPPPDGAQLVAQSRCEPTWADRIMVPLFDFYRTHISRRAAGDRKTYFTEYSLYRLPVALPAAK